MYYPIGISAPFRDLEPHIPQTPRIATPPERSRSADGMDERIKACYLVTHDCSHQSVEASPAPGEKCMACRAASPLKPSEALSCVINAINRKPIASCKRGTLTAINPAHIGIVSSLQALLETYKQFCIKFPFLEDQTEHILSEALQAAIYAECTQLSFEKFGNSTTTHPLYGLKWLFECIQKSAATLMAVQRNLATCLVDGKVLVNLNTNSGTILVEFIKKADLTFDVRVYNCEPGCETYHALAEKSGPHSETQDKKSYVFPVTYTGIRSDQIYGLAGALFSRTIGSITWNGFHERGFTLELDSSPISSVYEILRGTGREQIKPEDPTTLLAYRTSVNTFESPLIGAWFRQHCFEQRGGALWYRLFRARQLEMHLEIVESALLPPSQLLTRENNLLITEEALKVIHHRLDKAEHPSWDSFSAVYPIPHQQHPLPPAQMFPPTQIAPLETSVDQGDPSSQTCMLVSHECGHKTFSEVFTVIRPVTLCQSCHDAFTQHPSTTAENLRLLILSDIGCLTRLKQLREQAEDKEQYSAFVSRVDVREVYGTPEISQWLVANIQSFEGDNRFPTDELRTLLTDYSFVNSSMLTFKIAVSHLQASDQKAIPLLTSLYQAQEARSTLSSFIENRLETLTPGKKLIFPFSSEKHKLLLELQNEDENNFRITVFNTGLGLEHHIEIEKTDSQHAYFLPRQYSIPAKDITSVLHAIFGLQFNSITWNPANPTSFDVDPLPPINHLYRFLSSYKCLQIRRLSSTLPCRQQTLNTCQYDSLRAWLRQFCFEQGEVGVTWYRKFNLFQLERAVASLVEKLPVKPEGAQKDDDGYILELAEKIMSKRATKCEKPEWSRLYR